ncbi:MAG: ISNCY family transposase [Actinobacteria bacterium]|nr:ISNCY family transposase [Actinomycetota bacterium]
MRKRFEEQIAFGQTPIESVVIPFKSRDELPPVLAALQWIYITPEINEQIFQLLEKKVIGNKKQTGRKGMELWHILVLGVVRLALDCDYDRLEYLVHYDKLMRQIMGLDSTFSGEFGKGFHQKTISENVCHVDEDLLQKINEIVVKAGRSLIKKKEKILAKTDTYVLESNVHFPTDFNLLWDASRKCIRLLSQLCEVKDIEGWRKSKNWEQQIKGLMRMCGRANHSGGSKKKERIDELTTRYLEKAYQLEAKVYASVKTLFTMELSQVEMLVLADVNYFHEMLIKHIDLIDRRILKNEQIPHEEKVFFLFEPFTEWLTKGKLRPSVELGKKLLITTDQSGLVIDYKVLEKSSDSAETIGVVDRVLNRFGADFIGSMSFDKGFSNESDRELLSLFIPEVIMPKKGRLSKEEKAREGHRKFKALRHQHSAIESNINSLEHHGLNRCRDKGISGFTRYAGLGILAYNLHKIGNHLLSKKKIVMFREKEKLLKAA